MNLFNNLQKYPKAFKEFREWLYLRLDKNAKSFKTFGTYPDFVKIPFLMEFVESKSVPMLEALCYYNYESSNSHNFPNLCIYLIEREFQNIEQNIKLNYNVF
tara:strand:+ start:13 stop:318 length:306 start_codon:yes stop_codon:yes gene_type:complete